MKKYDIIAIGTGSAMNIISSVIRNNPDLKIAVIDKDEPGGICLTKGCIPTKILLYPAEVLRMIERAKTFGIDVDIKEIDFKFVMNRMREIINHDISNISDGLSTAKELDYYRETAEFIDDYTLKVGKEKIKGKMILLCTGSKPKIPSIKGVESVNYLTSDSILELTELPKSITIVGGGYIAAEYGHFLSAMGSNVTIIGRNQQFLPQEEPEVSALALSEFQKQMKVVTNFEVREVQQTKEGKIITKAVNRDTKEEFETITDKLLIAAGRSSHADILKPDKSGVDIDKNGWIKVNGFLETTKKNIWAFGDANGKYLFKHAANYESQIVYYNAIHQQQYEVDYHAIPRAVFSEPEIASVGMREEEAIKSYGKDNILIGFQRFQDTAKGTAMAIENFFVKIILKKDDLEILGAHIIGPHASVLIQEIINLMYTPERTIIPILQGMHIHPALNEVVERAAGNMMPVDQYHHFLNHLGLSEK